VDLVHEVSNQWESYIQPLGSLPFAFARLVVGVPQSWVDVNSMEDLDDAAISFRKKHGRRMRFATKYPRLTRKFFSRHGLIDYRIVESLGATEAAPANKTAEAICDLTSSGETLKNNELKMLQDGTIIESQASLFVSRVAKWDAAKKQTASILLEKMGLGASALETI
jgi:ATP phosphoribosyltransferase